MLYVKSTCWIIADAILLRHGLQTAWVSSCKQHRRAFSPGCWRQNPQTLHAPQLSQLAKDLRSVPSARKSSSSSDNAHEALKQIYPAVETVASYEMKGLSLNTASAACSNQPSDNVRVASYFCSIHLSPPWLAETR